MATTRRSLRETGKEQRRIADLRRRLLAGLLGDDVLDLDVLGDASIASQRVSTARDDCRQLLAGGAVVRAVDEVDLGPTD